MWNSVLWKLSEYTYWSHRIITEKAWSSGLLLTSSVSGAGFPQTACSRQDVSPGWVGASRALMGQVIKAAGRRWWLWEKSKLEFIMPMQKELNSGVRLTLRWHRWVAGVFWSKVEFFFFNPLMQMHKGEWCCGSAGRRAVLLPGDPTAITEDTFQWMTNKKLPPRLWLILYSPRKSSLFIFNLTKYFLLISGKTKPQASADLLLKTTHCTVAGEPGTEYKSAKKVQSE